MKPINLYELINADLETASYKLTNSDLKLLNKQPNNVVDFIQKALDEEIEKRTAEELEKKQPQFNVQSAPHPSEFFLPADSLANASKMFDECGEVELRIRRNANKVTVGVQKLTQDIRLATDEDELRAERGETPITRSEIPVENIPLPPPGTEIILPPPPRGQTRPAPKGVESVPQKRQDPQAPHLQTLEDATHQQEASPERRNPQVTPLTEEQAARIYPPVQKANNGLPVFIGLPTIERNAEKYYSIYGQLKKCLGKLKVTSRIDIRQARNVIADSFLKSDAEWLYMQDDDVIAPFGNAGLFQKIVKERSLSFPPDLMGIVAAETLIQSGKSFVGAVYCTHDQHKMIACNLGINPKDEKDRLTIAEVQKRGPRAGLLEVEWMGFGCVVIHKQVFLDIAKASPLQRKHDEPIDFFDFITGGEDVGFCRKAIKVGHKPFLNTAVWCAHLGEHAFLP